MFAKCVLPLFIAAAYAVTPDTEPPVISLHMDTLPTDGAVASVADQRTYASQYTGTSPEASTASYQRTCVVKTNPADCKAPVCKAWDHHDAEVDCSESIFLVNDDGTALTPDDNLYAGESADGAFHPWTEIDYNLRSEWIIKYDAEDFSGNAAEQVAFAMIMDDPVKPVVGYHSNFAHGCSGTSFLGSNDHRSTNQPATADGTPDCTTSNTDDGSTTTTTYGSLTTYDRAHKLDNAITHNIEAMTFNDRWVLDQTTGAVDDTVACDDTFDAYAKSFGDGCHAFSTKRGYWHLPYIYAHDNYDSAETIMPELEVKWEEGTLTSQTSTDHVSESQPSTGIWEKQRAWAGRHITPDDGSLPSDTSYDSPVAYTPNSDSWPYITTESLGTWELSMKVCDFAGVFGLDGENNCATHVVTVTVQDTADPEVLCAVQTMYLQGDSTTLANWISTDSLEVLWSVDNIAGGDNQCAVRCEEWNARRFQKPDKSYVEERCSAWAVAGDLSTCTLYTGNAPSSTFTFSIDRPDGTEGFVAGYNLGCQETNYHECNVPMPNADPAFAIGANTVCVDSRDSWSKDQSYDEVFTARSPSFFAPTVVGDDRHSIEAATVLYETKTVDGVQKINLPKENAVPVKTTGTYTMTYTCEDRATNSASKTRTVVIQDTRPPKLELYTLGHHGLSKNETGHWEDSDLNIESFTVDIHHVIEHSAGYTKDLFIIEHLDTEGWGFSCTDDCDPAVSTTTTWYSANGTECSGCDCSDATEISDFDTFTPGVYVLQYQCTDSAGLTDTQCRTVINEDKTAPVLTIVGQDIETVEASSEDDYVDQGATCSDRIDGSGLTVTTSGDLVDRMVVDTYEITYHCSDSEGNEAVPLTRTVHVVKDTCARCSIPTCLDGHLGHMEGGEDPNFDVVCHLRREASFPYVDAGATCSDDVSNVTTITLGTVNTEMTGNYTLTYIAYDPVSKMWNYDDGCSNGAQSATRVVHVEDTLKPVITLFLDKDDPSTTSGKSMQIVHSGHRDADHGLNFENQPNPANFPVHTGDAPYNTEALTAANADGLTAGQYPLPDDAGEPGKFGTYNPQTMSGYESQLTTAQGLDLMAEQAAAKSVSNTFLFGAVGMATAGLALVVYGMVRRPAQIVTVPV